MKRLIIICIALLLPVAALAWMNVTTVGGGGVPAASSKTSLTEDFNCSDGALGTCDQTWTTIKGTVNIASNVARQASAGSAGAVANTACTGVDQYIKLTNVLARAYQGMVFRYTDASSPFYILEMASTGAVAWYKISNQTVWGATKLSAVDSDIGELIAGSTWGATISGTGDDTVVRLWFNPTGDAPDAGGATWGSSAPYVSYTDNPGANAVDTGGKIGFEGYNASANQIDFDNWFGGDIP